MQSVMDHFRIKQKVKEAKDQERRKWFIAARDQQRAKEQRIDQADDALLDMMTAEMLADAVQVTQFRAKLDTYDQATVTALMENQALLDAVRTRIDGMLDSAHMIEDGRRVFKTRNGERVYDEHGSELSQDIIHPDQISDSAPYWESYQEVRQQEFNLMQERQDILEFQEKLDQARDRSDTKDFTQGELDDLEADLADSAPPSVAKHMPGFEAKANLKLKTEFSAPSSSLESRTSQPQAAPSAPGF